MTLLFILVFGSGFFVVVYTLLDYMLWFLTNKSEYDID